MGGIIQFCVQLDGKNTLLNLSHDHRKGQPFVFSYDVKQLCLGCEASVSDCEGVRVSSK